MSAKEQALRQEAIRRRLQGERRCDICRDLNRSTQWFDKWWAEYRRDPHAGFANRSRTPQTSPQQTAPEVEQAIVNVRKTLEAASTPETRYGFIGQRAIQSELERLKFEAIPSTATIQRILQRHQLTHPLGAASAWAYYPWPIAWAVNAIHATDIITRHIRGGTKIENFHTIDLYSHAVHLTPALTKTSTTACAHLLENWADLGLPALQQLDNEGAFCGGHTHPHVIGRVVRLCLFCGIEPCFTPFYEPKRNHQIETFHSLWCGGFWSRHEFRDLAHVQAEEPLYLRWYLTRYRPPALQGQTPAQIRAGASCACLTEGLRRLVPVGRLPITAGRIHFMRKVNGAGFVELLNEPWLAGRKWVGEYVRVTIDTAEQRLTIWHQAEAEAAWHLLKTRCFRLKEPVHELLPAFRRNRLRCRDHWPG